MVITTVSRSFNKHMENRIMANNLGITANDTKPFIFVSYNTSDKDRVARIVNAISRYDINIWYDNGIARGSRWEREIA